jgi:hypothetical protein
MARTGSKIADAAGTAENGFPREKPRAGLRVAIVSTPRSGNTWLWHLLTALYDAPGMAAHHPADVPWDNLPDDLVLQLHWRRTDAFLIRLQQQGFQVVVLARHPLDVLISILHFVVHDANTSLWLAGEGGNEQTIRGAMPRSTGFLEYARSPRAAALLAVGREWWSASGCHQVRYEELSRDPVSELERLVKALGRAPRKTSAEAVETCTIPRLRARWQTNHYFWLGKTGLWRCLLPVADAEALGPALQSNLSVYGYPFDPDPALTGLQADHNWVDLIWPGLYEDLQSLKRVKHERNDLQSQLEASQETLHQMTAELTAARQSLLQASLELREANRQVAELREASQQLAAQLAEANHQVAKVGPLGPLTLQLAKTMRHFCVHHPRAASLVKKAIRWAG